MSHQTVLIAKDRLRYLEFLEANKETIINNAVFEIIEREKHTQAKRADNCINCSTMVTSTQAVQATHTNRA